MNAQILAQPSLRDLYVWFVGEDVNILNSEGVCLASSDSDRVNQKVLDIKNLEETHYLAQLKCKFCNAKLILNKDDELKSEKELSFLKSLAELSMQQYFRAKEATFDNLDQFVVKLVSEKINSKSVAQFEIEAKSLGLNFDHLRLAVIVYFKNFEQRLFLQTHHGDESLELIQKLKRDIAASINGFFTKNNDLIIAYVGQGKFLVYKAVVTEEEDRLKGYLKKAYSTIFGPLLTRENGEMVVGFGNAHASINGLIESYHEADLALKLGQKTEYFKNPIFYFDDFNELRILAEEDNGKKLGYAQEIIGRLKNEELRKTLETFFTQDLNITNTAQSLSIHPNTVLYRLKKIRDTLGLDPKVFEDATAIQMALLTQRFLS